MMRDLWRWSACIAFTMTMASVARAHSASDAYLSLQGAGATSAGTVVHVQWDIALRDLDFVMALDADGDGNITWDELRVRQDDIARYAAARLRASSAGAACTLVPGKQLVATHPDGAYAALFFDVRCAGKPRTVQFDYQLFFAIDPSHRAIVTMQAGTSVATALLAPDKARVVFKLMP